MRRPFWKAAPRFRRIPRGRPAGHAEAGPCELSHRRLHHEDGASLAPGAPPLGCGFIGIYAAQAEAPAPPALIGFAYLRLWARGNSPEKRLP